MMLYKNTKVKVRSPDWNTDYSDIVANVLQGDTLAPYLFIICLDYVLRRSIDKMKDNGFKLAKERSGRYLTQTIMDTDYAEAFDSIRRGKMEQILFIYSLPKETIAAIMMPYKNTKVKVHSPDGEGEVLVV